jgi:hypothetical protein
MIQTAANLGEVFGTDPLILLDVTEVEWAIRIACGAVIAEQRAEQADAQRQATASAKR